MALVIPFCRVKDGDMTHEMEKDATIGETSRESDEGGQRCGKKG